MKEKHGNEWIELLKILGMGMIALLPVVFVWAYIRYFPMSYGDDETAYYLWNRTVCNTPSERDYDVLILGDSAANAAFLPEALSESTINLSLGGTTVVENYYVLSDWLAHHNAPKVVYLSFIDYHLIYDNMFYERTVYTHRLRPDQEKEILAAARECEDGNIAVEDAEKRLLSYDMYLPNMYLPSLLNAGFNGRGADNEARYENVNFHRGSYIGLTNTIYSESRTITFDRYLVNPLYETYYRKVLDLCKENGIQVRIISLPKTQNSFLSTRYLSQRDSFYEGLEEEYDNVTYYAGVQQVENWYFLDWEHFNVFGGFAWSRHIRDTFPSDFGDEPMSDYTSFAVADDLRMSSSRDEVMLFCDGKDLFAVALVSEEQEVMEGFRDTGLTFQGKKVWLQTGNDYQVMVNETDGSEKTLAFAENEDGTCSFLYHGTYYPLEVDPNSVMVLIAMNTHDHSLVTKQQYLIWDLAD